jgi:hypothetical protein
MPYLQFGKVLLCALLSLVYQPKDTIFAKKFEINMFVYFGIDN